MLEFVIDQAKLSVSHGNQSIVLTKSELAIFQALYLSFGKTVSRQQLLKAMTGTTVPIKTRTVDVHISTLRKKIAIWGDLLIISVYRSGYMMLYKEDGSEA